SPDQISAACVMGRRFILVPLSLHPHASRKSSGDFLCEGSDEATLTPSSSARFGKLIRVSHVACYFGNSSSTYSLSFPVSVFRKYSSGVVRSTLVKISR